MQVHARPVDRFAGQFRSPSQFPQIVRPGGYFFLLSHSVWRVSQSFA